MACGVEATGYPYVTGFKKGSLPDRHSLQDLRRSLCVKAKAGTNLTFLGLYIHVSKIETPRQVFPFLPHP
jgi:hypothetical protein